jgi:hypothetical protein
MVLAVDGQAVFYFLLPRAPGELVETNNFLKWWSPPLWNLLHHQHLRHRQSCHLFQTTNNFDIC